MLLSSTLEVQYAPSLSGDLVHGSGAFPFLELSLTVVVFFTVKGDQRVDSFDIIWRAVLIESSEKGSCFCIL